MEAVMNNSDTTRPIGPLPERVVETHVHFWDHSVDGLKWSWLLQETGWGYEGLDCPHFSPEEFARDASDVPLTKVVHMQCADVLGAVAEARFIQEMASFYGWPHACVAGCSLISDDAPQVLEQLAAFPLFRGIRDSSPDLRSLTNREARKGLGTLRMLCGSCEVFASPHQFDALMLVAEQNPEVLFVLGGCGYPELRTDDYFQDWLTGMSRLSRLTNVVCKISGLSRKDPDWSASSLRPWILGCVDAFGADRCMFGGDWPPSRLASTYRELVAAYQVILSELTNSEQEAVFAATAERVYRI
jgi:predicted TIM-barrel fold metal-dependent hydrolase